MKLRCRGLGTVATSNPGIQRQLVYVAKLRYLGLGTLTTSNPGIQAIGSWARYLGSGTLTTGNPDSRR